MKEQIQAAVTAVIARGYAMMEEVELLCSEDNSDNRILVIVVIHNDCDKGYIIAGIALDEHRFLMASDLPGLVTDRPIRGMVAWRDNEQMDGKKSLEMWRATGDESVRYYHADKPITPEEEVQVDKIYDEMIKAGKLVPKERILWRLRFLMNIPGASEALPRMIAAINDPNEQVITE